VLKCIDFAFRIASGGSLYIYNITAADSGEYECAAVNARGKISAKATVSVRGMTHLLY
jgi:Immunoglobulin I-set domain